MARSLLLVAAAVAACVLLAVAVRGDDAREDETLRKARDAQGSVDRLSDEMMTKMHALETDFHRQKLPVFSERNKILATVKGFWGRVIEHHPSHTAWFRGNDKELLPYLKDVHVADLADKPEDHGRTQNYRITMTFDPNPFFSDTTLFRENKFVTEEEVATVSGIKWTAGKQPSEPSFFNFFENKGTHTFFLDENQMADIAHVIRYEFWPNPFTYHDLPNYDDFVDHQPSEFTEEPPHPDMEVVTPEEQEARNAAEAATFAGVDAPANAPAETPAETPVEVEIPATPAASGSASASLPVAEDATKL